jgi:SAM-dependent methyltransferase
LRYRTSGRRAGQRFDARHRVTTEALIFLGDLDADLVGANVQHATHYEPTPVADFEALMSAAPLDCGGTTFIDIGSGMGRVVLLAARHTFKQVVGIELSPALHAVAVENRRRWVDRLQRCRDIHLIVGDACTFRFPAGNLLLYLYNPFGPSVLRALLEKLLCESPPSREIVLCYHTPVERAAIEDTGAFKLVKDLHFGVIYRRRSA